jgi:DNA-binding transcriptional regulator YdaS (Cro superfamily)
MSTRNIPSYMSEAWFALLQGACVNRQRRAVAEQLGLSPVTVSQVLNASGKYGAGTASTARVARRVLDTFGSVQ